MSFDVVAARRRCRTYRRRILDISQQVTALHAAAAFSCLEVVDLIYHGLMRRAAGGGFVDSFVMSKGHGCMAQYVVLEDLGVLTRRDLDLYCTPSGRLGCHPDYGVPGIEASTGSLGHGLGMATGMAYADRIQGEDRRTYVVLSDGELQEGSTWEALQMAANLGVDTLVAFVDLNDMASLSRMSETHPAFYPVLDKLRAFGWETAQANGHDAAAVWDAVTSRQGGRPFALVAETVKGRGVAFMEHVPIWHYRSPNRDEYTRAVAELAEVSS
ncbi:MAG TPA: 1-deoxy-D-xylulose-5-phosphate synthase N-terminal domain-containing protein [Candidatus Acidoferrum sp.]|nr:1-deoxy-D-xylulose-5-phosphate synthase N-terminal domain-containing protein [Candidatus Acidoferrum sp.]